MPSINPGDVFTRKKSLDKYKPGQRILTRKGRRALIRKNVKMTLLCSGMDNTCLKFANTGSLCAQCFKNGEKQFDRKIQKPTIMVIDNQRFKCYRDHKIRLCVALNNTCEKVGCCVGYLCMKHKKEIDMKLISEHYIENPAEECNELIENPIEECNELVENQNEQWTTEYID
jgi:hypothetical protein